MISLNFLFPFLFFFAALQGGGGNFFKNLKFAAFYSCKFNRTIFLNNVAVFLDKNDLQKLIMV